MTDMSIGRCCRDNRNETELHCRNDFVIGIACLRIAGHFQRIWFNRPDMAA